jgi:hypothetical protein
MSKALLFIPDISGFTRFVQNTEAEHSQHVIAELLEVLISANTQELQLAEVEGDALFFYKLSIPSLEKLLAQIETMFTAFYGHLRLLETNRICPCKACATAPKLELKIVAHCGDFKFITVQGNKKPFGPTVIEAHRLLKNSINSDNYTLITGDLASAIELSANYKSKLYEFREAKDTFDAKELAYLFSEIKTENLHLLPFYEPRVMEFNSGPNYTYEQTFPVSAKSLLEIITNYKYRHHWVDGVDEFLYDEDEVTRLGTEHTCVINGRQLNFETVTKKGKPNDIVYGEVTQSIPMVEALYQFYVITPRDSNSCSLRAELYWSSKSSLKRLLISLLFKRTFIKNTHKAMENLLNYVSKNNQSTTK